MKQNIFGEGTKQIKQNKIKQGTKVKSLQKYYEVDFLFKVDV